MGLPRYTIYKYCKTAKGWRYCKPAWGKNNKLKPNVVLVGGREETHPEGMYYLNVDGQWEKAGTTAVEAQDAQRKRLARQVYERQKNRTPKTNVSEEKAPVANKVGSKIVSKKTQSGKERAANPGPSQGEWPMRCKLRIKFRSEDVPKVLSAVGVTPEGDRKERERQLGLVFSTVRMSPGWRSVTAGRKRASSVTQTRLRCPNRLSVYERQPNP